MRAAVIMMVLLVLRSIGAAAPASATTGTAERASERSRGGDDDDVDENDEHESTDATDTTGNDGELAGARVAVTGPSIRAVLAAAYAAAGLDRDPGRGWIRRARLAGLIPWVTVRTTRDTSWQDAHSEVGHGNTFEVRATWRLDRLLFDGRELQVATIESARRRERQRLATRVIRSYFAWRRASGVAVAAGSDRRAARVAEATAELDALTDGWFSNELTRRRRGASRARPPPTAAP